MSNLLFLNKIWKDLEESQNWRKTVQIWAKSGVSTRERKESNHWDELLSTFLTHKNSFCNKLATTAFASVRAEGIYGCLHHAMTHNVCIGCYPNQHHSCRDVTAYWVSTMANPFRYTDEGNSTLLVWVHVFWVLCDAFVLKSALRSPTETSSRG